MKPLTDCVLKQLLTILFQDYEYEFSQKVACNKD